jgi:MFS transporter, UMF1 family
MARDCPKHRPSPARPTSDPRTAACSGRPADPAGDPRAIRAWCLYDWANSAFATTVMAAIFPPFYRALVLKAGKSEAAATAYWGYTTALALAAIAVLGPILGAISDHTGGKKRYLLVCAAMGMLATAAFVVIGEDTWILASGLFVAANVGFAAANVFYESLLPSIAAPGQIDQVSTRGYALGYVGGGLLLAIHLLWYQYPAFFGFPDTGVAIRACFLSVALWWAAFSVPLLRRVPEPPPAPAAPARQPGAGRPARVGALPGGFGRLAVTFHSLRRYRQVVLFLIAFWFYNDGIGTIVKMATAYGDEIGIRLSDMIAALLITQFVGVPATFGMGALARRISAKRTILLTLCVYGLITVGGYFMRSTWHFYMLALAVGLVQGGAQALSRSLFAVMIPRHKSAEFFGFYSTSARLAGIAGPLLFGLVSQAAGSSRLSILSLLLFFLAGALLLAKVDVATGQAAAAAADAAAQRGATEAADAAAQPAAARKADAAAGGGNPPPG